LATLTRNKRKDESKGKKNGQGFNKINRICSLSRLLNESYSTLITSKIEEYRKNDALLAEKSDSDIIQHYIRKLVEYRSKMAYFAGVRGKMFFAFLHEELEHATNDSDRDQIWSNILNKNDKSILTTIFNQLCNPRCEKSRFKLMQQVIDVSNNIELLTALDIQEITDSDSLFSSLASIMAPRAIQKSLAIELKTSIKFIGKQSGLNTTKPTGLQIPLTLKNLSKSPASVSDFRIYMITSISWKRRNGSSLSMRNGLHLTIDMQ